MENNILSSKRGGPKPLLGKEKWNPTKKRIGRTHLGLHGRTTLVKKEAG